MNLLFLIPLIMGVLILLLSSQFDEEVSKLLKILTALSFLISLILAPWEFQILILTVAVLSTSRIGNFFVGKN